MIIFLFSDKNCEYQAINCIKSLVHKITDDVKVVYYTIGFNSDFEFKNLYKVRIEKKAYFPTYHFYKSELALLTMDMFPDEYYMFTDTDVLFSRNFNFNDHKYNETYPMASYGPHEYPYLWADIDGVRVTFNETKLMQYFGVGARSMRYCWSCFFTFNPNCREFFEEYVSMCKNKYLMDRRKDFFPYADETAFNICLWKRNATKNLGFAFVNTHLIETVKEVETKSAKNKTFNNVLDAYGASWEYVDDPNKVLLYHGFKDANETSAALEYLIN